MSFGIPPILLHQIPTTGLPGEIVENGDEALYDEDFLRRLRRHYLYARSITPAHRSLDIWTSIESTHGILVDALAGGAFRDVHAMLSGMAKTHLPTGFYQDGII